MSSIEEELLEFSLKLFKELSNEDNCVFSPFSVTTCLSMVLMAIRSNCSQELSTALFGRTIEAQKFELLAKQLKTLTEKCFDKNSNAIISTNFMYSDSKFQVLSQFKQLIENYFWAKVKELDFMGDSNKAVEVINSDISEATNGKIDKLLDDISEDTKVVLANALYFKGLWKSQFDKQNTTTDKFTTNGGQQIDVQMMYKSTKMPFAYSQQLKTRAVELNYENTNAVMIVLLPDTESSLKQMRNDLSIQSINQLVESLRTVKVDLSLPKFKIESKYDLIPSLNSVGIKGIFDRSADFSGLSQQKGLFVSKVVQKAIIEVNEEGTEAAAATAAGIMLMCMEFNEEFRADRPFMYLLVTKNDNKKVDSILFIGECNHPNA